MSQFVINVDGTIEQDKVFLCDRMLNILGQITPIEELRTIMHLNSNDEVSFKIYKYVDGNKNFLWDKTEYTSIILVEGKGYFEITVPKTEENVTFKTVHGTSLGETETSQSYINLEFNTEDDILRTDYVPRVLYNNENHKGSILHILFEEMPHYAIGHVDDSIADIQRTFEFNGTVYEALQEIEEEIECIFIFDNFSRTINCYDLKDHCTNPECIHALDYRNVIDGVCQHCHSGANVLKGYGKYSGVKIDTSNLVETITLEGDKDSLKNCFKIEGGDDIITNRIANRLISGNRIWKFSDIQIALMSQQLQDALKDYTSLVQSHQDRYNRLWDEYNQNIDTISYYEHEMMPSFETDGVTSNSVFRDIFNNITYACISNKYQGATAINSSVSSFARLLTPSGYKVELTTVSTTSENDGGTSVINSITFKAHVYLANHYKEDNITLEDEYHSSNFTLPVKKGYKLYSSDGKTFTNDYYLYLKQQMEIAQAKCDATEEVVTFNPPITDNASYNTSTTPFIYERYDNKTNPNNLPDTHYTMYCINRLKSFFDAYESCSQVLASLNSQIATKNKNVLQYVTSSGSKGDIQEKLLNKYKRYMECISVRINYLQSIVDNLKRRNEELLKEINEIREQCNMQFFLENYNNGSYQSSLWFELCSFKREDTYRNDNFIGEGVSETVITKNIEDLIKRANEEIEKASELKYTITTTIGNLLTMSEFQPFWDDFTLGNYIFAEIDEEIYRLRLISVSFNYDDLSTIEVEFSEATKNSNPVSNLSETIRQAQNMATNFNFVTKQANRGNTANTEFRLMREQGLDIANTMITSSNNQDFLINQYGVTGRKWSDIKDDYEEEQIRIINNLLCFTDDNWAHTVTALGKIWYNDNGEWKYGYGLNAQILMSELILSNKLKIINNSGTYSITDDGFLMKNKGNIIELNPTTPHFRIYNGSVNILDFNSDGQEKLRIGNGITLEQNGDAYFDGRITGGSLDIGSSYGRVIIDPEQQVYGNNYIFAIKNGSGRAVMYADIYGNCFYSGSINVNDKFIVKSNGDLITRDGKIISASIESGTITSTTINTSTINSATINGGTLTIGSNFEVDSSGNLTARSGEIGGWTIENNGIYNYGNNFLTTIGNSYLYSYNGKYFQTTINNGKIVCGLMGTYNFPDTSDVYSDLSASGIFCKSYNGTSTEYLFKADNTTDSVTISNHSSNPALTITNNGTGDTLLCQNTTTGQENKAFHCKVYTGDGQEKFLSVFGERTSSLNRIVFRADVGDDNGADDPNPRTCLKSALGTKKYPWGIVCGDEIYSTSGTVSTSDLKKKDVIGVMDKQKSLDFINALEPIEYTFKDSVNKRIHMGFGAQTVAKVAKDLDMGDLSIYEASYFDGETSEAYYQEGADDSLLSWGLKYAEFEAPMVAAIQLLSEKVTELEKELKELKKG